MMHIEKENITTENNKTIIANFYHPEKGLKGAVIIAPALGVPQSFYTKFALWLSAKGFLVATFDYSEMGDSKSSDIRQSDVTLTHWAKFDCKIIIDITQQKINNKPLYWVGHSLGGQLVGMVPNIDKVSKVFTIASGSGYWKENAPSLKKKVWLLWYILAPMLTPIFGYFPGKRIGMVGDLPKGVIKQWRLWCLNANYLMGIEGQHITSKYNSFDRPIISLSFTDDQLMSQKNIQSLHSFFGKSNVQMFHLSPKTLNTEKIGHFGFFNNVFSENQIEDILLSEMEA